MDTLIVKSYTKEEAIKEAERRGFTTIVDITRYWSKLGKPNVNNLKSEIIDTMRRKRIIDKKGFAYMVVLKDNSKTLRKRRFKCVNRSTGQKQYYLSVIEIRTEEDQLVGRFTSKREAIIFARGISKKYNIRTIARRIKTSANDEDSIIFTFEPCKDFKQEKSIFFFFGNYQENVICEI